VLPALHPAAVQCFTGTHLNPGPWLLQGKDEVAGIAERGGEVLPALQRAAPGLTLQQLHKLTEHHHDDWAVGERVRRVTSGAVACCSC
jgi:hypothetical protein